jgi:membrane-associated phospholipid phosphatase
MALVLSGKEGSRMRAAVATVLLTLLAPWLLPGQTAAPPAPAVEQGRTVGWLTLPRNIASDQKRIWTFPAKLARGRHLLPALALIGATAALVETDPHTAPNFRNTTRFKGFNSVFTSNRTDLGTMLVPATLYAVGLATRNSHARTTALLAGEAVASAEILTIVAKDLDRRRRPSTYPPHTNMADSWFNDRSSWYRSRGSFPSGHTIAAFSVATVIARRYPRHRKWLPYVAYGLAGVVGFSRLTLSSHFPSDVLVGGVLGYSIGRFAVLRQ